MKIIHTADLHLGQVIYQNYDRTDEHSHFFARLGELCVRERPDALVVSGDVFDIQQPSATVKRYFTENFVRLHSLCPEMRIVVVAGNHDSASRLQAESSLWEFAGARVVGVPPDGTENPDRFIVRLPAGYIVALPYMSGERTETVQSLLDLVAEENAEGLPVVMTGHLAVSGMDATGHDGEIGKIRTQNISSLGTGYDYLALGHIHKPQTIGHQEDCLKDDVTYPSGAVRYSGSALHVSCDEKYPHSVSIVEIGRRGGNVRIRQERIDGLLHFHELPAGGGPFTSSEEALQAVREFAEEQGRGYFRLRFDCRTVLPPDFCNAVYDIIGACGDSLRFNPKHLWTGGQETDAETREKPAFEVAELQQMTDPMMFIGKTAGRYPEFSLDELREAFVEAGEEIRRMEEEEKASAAKRAGNSPRQKI